MPRQGIVYEIYAIKTRRKARTKPEPPGKVCICGIRVLSPEGHVCPSKAKRNDLVPSRS